MERKQRPDSRLDVARANIRSLAEKRDMSLSEIGRKAGMARNGVQQFTVGLTSISYINMLRVCGVLNTPIATMHLPESENEQKTELHSIVDALPNSKIAELLRQLKSSPELESKK